MTSRTPARVLLLALVALIAVQVVSRPLRARTSASRRRRRISSRTKSAPACAAAIRSVVADLNKDGKPDIIALASGLPELLWYENPGWQKHVLAGGVAQLINASVYDIDGDGIPEIAIAQGFTTATQDEQGAGRHLLTHGADVTQPWTYKEIDAVPTAHRLRWIDADGSGKKMLVMAPLIGDGLAPRPTTRRRCRFTSTARRTGSARSSPTRSPASSTASSRWRGKA